MKEEFTPGPWTACTDDGWEGIVHSPEGRTVATCPWDERAKADAQLIAQAPALLEALEEMLDAYAPFAQRTVDQEGESALHSAVRNARAAIAKATGD